MVEVFLIYRNLDDKSGDFLAAPKWGCIIRVTLKMWGQKLEIRDKYKYFWSKLGKSGEQLPPPAPPPRREIPS